MGFEFSQIGGYPKTVKWAITTLIAGWLLHFLFLYRYFPDLLNYRQPVVGALICVFVVMIKRWARMLCIFFNIGVAGIDLFFGVLLFSSSKSAFAGDVVFLLSTFLPAAAFIASTVFLLTGECGHFFKTFEANRRGDASG